MKNLLFTLITVCSLASIYGQNYDFGKVSKSELQEKYYPTDSTANAAILYRNEEVRFTFNQNDGFSQEREVHVRIKIYDKEGFDWATHKVYLYKGGRGNNEQLKGLKAFTYNLENGKIEEDKLKKDGIFDEKVSEFGMINSFTLPNIKAGSVIEYKYIVSSQFPFIDDLELQFTIPVKKLEAKIATPQVFRYNKFLNPKAYYLAIYNESKTDRTLTTRSKYKNGSYVGSGNSYQSNSMRYFDNVIEFSEENIPALKTESFGGSLNNYKAKLSMELEAILNLDGIVTKSFASSWQKVSKSIYDNEDFGGQLNRTGFFKNDLEPILQGVEDDFAKAFIIESFVKSKVKWNEKYGKFAQKGIRTAYNEGIGNVADINLLVTAMLRSQGVNANPVLISTRNNGVPLFPTRDGFNYVICMVQSENKYMLIDATEPFSTNNVLPERVLNWQGRVLKKDGTSNWVNINSNNKSVESTMLNVKINDDFSATGKVRKNYTAYLALNYRKKYTGLGLDDHIKSLESNKGDIEISELVYENDVNITEPAKVTYEYELLDGIDEVGDKIYFSPLLFLATKESPFKLEDRKYPIDFVIPLEDKYMVNIMLPEGYKVESLPATEAFEYKGGEAKFVYVAKENGKYLQFSVSLELNNTFIEPKDYKGFKDFFAKTVEKQAEQIVLTKA
ncbi:transglutaminase domain-containing protein [Winogradskyella sp.]|uniref:DUF3857 domain-containing protein n=1 Tax=Winogradskyella sp. TaxID=1883156 RepID=UPI003F6B41A3